MALSRGPCWQQCRKFGNILWLQHGPSTAASAEGLTPALAALNLSCVRTFKSSSSSYRTRDGPQQERKTSRNSALTDASNQNSVAGSADPWKEVVHKETGQVYYWNKQTNETTALGEPKPGPEGRGPVQQVAVGRGTSLLGLVGVGAGVGLTFALIGRLLGG
ncbi:g11145 [Coccomyxa viridis]|uniref:G11145 protein n=1 Tax=Coccomyxa viridis TaxID=1274662 RepID=A0ABP1G9V6_9CHLO